MSVDTEAIESAIEQILEAVSEHAVQSNVEGTPQRIASFWEGMSPDKSFGTFLIKGEYDQLVVVKNIPFYSICGFNLFPFWGHVSVGYLADGALLELSGIQELIKGMTSCIITQEALADVISKALRKLLEHENVGVVIRASHFNIKDSLRIQESVSSVMQGAFREEPSVRQEFLALCKE